MREIKKVYINNRGEGGRGKRAREGEQIMQNTMQVKQKLHATFWAETETHVAPWQSFCCTKYGREQEERCRKKNEEENTNVLLCTQTSGLNAIQ